MLKQFEEELDPANLAASRIPVKVLGYGEMSTVLQVGDDAGRACKRMPLFSSRKAAELYEKIYREYCGLLGKAGLLLPHDEVYICEPPKRPVTLYIVQRQFPPDHFAHKLIHGMNKNEAAELLERIVEHIGRLWVFNRAEKPELELALDGQLSNWVAHDDGLYYVDTSTPLLRKNGVEQLDPELFLRGAPSFLRWVIRWFFLDDVMNRYYDRRQVLIDLAANLYKEQRPELIPTAIDVINASIEGDARPLTAREIAKYYREDKRIWRIWIAFRRVDRWIKTKVARKRYDFVLPGKIKR